MPPAHPELTKGMIPVRWSGENWIKAAENNQNINYQWYNYDKKIWANAVTVISSTREKHMRAPVGSVIPINEINTMWVWIPRYKYKLFNDNAMSVEEQLIEIEFDDNSLQKANGSRKGEWLTHPAFTFGDEEINGFWVAKFEPSGSLNDIKIIPNGFTIRDKRVREMYEASRAMENKETYGFGKDGDIHMMKDSEWGAVAYLSHSKYGKGDEVWINNYDAFVTGCAGNYVDEGPISQCAYKYDEPNGENASTTGNIYGVYDMSGGAYEYTMGMYRPTDSTYVKDIRSGFNAETSDGDLPESKYWDRYITTDSWTACGEKRCYGYALRETKHWYADTANFVNANEPWMRHGGTYSYGSIGGIFVFDDADGAYWSDITFRVTLIKKN
ncbi:MAG: hypothetical protein GX247_00890 [Mollicutes bacterium]|nr:hypothetical protein [Mollicutes bacterium]